MLPTTCRACDAVDFAGSNLRQRSRSEHSVGIGRCLHLPANGRTRQAKPGWLGRDSRRPGCSPQSCAFRDQFADLKTAGVAAVYGLSTQDTAYQREAAKRLQLPFALLSDERFAMTNALRLPTFKVGPMVLLKRLTLVLRDGEIVKTFYPVVPPDRNAGDVLQWLVERRA